MIKKSLLLAAGMAIVVTLISAAIVSQRVMAKEGVNQQVVGKEVDQRVTDKDSSCPSSSNSIGEWFDYSNGVTAGYSGKFVPTAGFSYLHVDEIDIALNGPFQASGENIWVQITLHYSDGSSQTAGSIHPFYPNLVSQNIYFTSIPNVYWKQPNTNTTNGDSGKHITSVSYIWGADNNQNSQATMIIAATGFEMSR